MKLKKDLNLEQFFQAVRRCKGQVWFRTPEEDCLNLKSQLSQYVFIAAYLEYSLTLNGIVACELEEDLELLADFLAET